MVPALQITLLRVAASSNMRLTLKLDQVSPEMLIEEFEGIDHAPSGTKQMPRLTGFQ